ncbi:two-component system LytT family response regulator [Natronobacillus azotifigens]|uniref:LytTR family DNA-binding domain-containing protein n=1 Tax=Natronobacillus azotifigens TaxID=472978 RepID=A0A9J6RC15_9BACI|nr:LytTR family DNA-binding domain-containing protein [Natronobacillus azotifigens]MCZ0703087.1 LytTR family DNA-binding domain-containing protein [Natronobacillus azotifigens]
MDSKIKLVIADDNLDAQEIMSTFILPIEFLELIDVVDNGASLLEVTINRKPDLILADINIPKLNVVKAVSSCLEVNPNVKFIFLTAYQEYAVDVFELNAVDYLIKPIKKERLYSALEKARRMILDPIQQAKKILTIQMNRNSYFIHFHSIICIERANRKTVIHTLEEIYETNESLDSISKRLNSDFYRTHRSFIVNVYSISHISLEGETYLAHLKNYPHHVHVSKRRIKDLYKEISYSSKEP